MKNIGWILFAAFGLLVGFACSAQTPPPNDNFTNRTQLTGTDVTFTGSLAGATLESSQEVFAFTDGAFPFGVPDPNESVWWEWSAPTSTTLYFEIIGCSTNQAFGDLLVVYQATNSAPSAGSLYPPVARMVIDPTMLAPTLVMPVVAGTSYQITLLGSSSADYTIRLLATNALVINQQPRSQTVFSNASAVFYVASTGLGPTTYQWRFGTNDLSGETAPLLALTNIDSSMTGVYTVVASNASGAITSAPATLAISQSKALASLQAAGMRSHSFVFNLTGESGRSYRVESSTNLVDWQSEPAFPLSRYSPTGASVVYYTNSPVALAVTNNFTCKFFRARPYTTSDPAAEICINNLRQICIAKILLFRDVGVSSYFSISSLTTPEDGWLLPYFSHGRYPFCPLDEYQLIDTSYNFQRVNQEPLCQIDPFDHILEEAP